MTIEINGMAHVILTVSRFEVAREFYRKLLPEFGMKPVFEATGCSTALALEPRSASNPATRRWLANALCSNEWACTTSACVPVRVRTWTDALLFLRKWTRPSCAAPWKAIGLRAITTCCSRIQTASG